MFCANRPEESGRLGLILSCQKVNRVFVYLYKNNKCCLIFCIIPFSLHLSLILIFSLFLYFWSDTTVLTLTHSQAKITSCVVQRWTENQPILIFSLPHNLLCSPPCSWSLALCAPWPHFICRFIWLRKAWPSLQSGPTESPGPGPLFEVPRGQPPTLHTCFSSCEQLWLPYVKL